MSFFFCLYVFMSLTVFPVLFFLLFFYCPTTKPVHIGLYKVMQGMTNIHMLTRDRLSPDLYPVDYNLVPGMDLLGGAGGDAHPPLPLAKGGAGGAIFHDKAKKTK
jgi:hypothetical protein